MSESSAYLSKVENGTYMSIMGQLFQLNFAGAIKAIKKLDERQ